MQWYYTCSYQNVGRSNRCQCFLGRKNKTVYITLTGLETTTESTSAIIEEPTVSTTTVVSTVPTTTVPTTTAPIAPSIPDAPEK